MEKNILSVEIGQRLRHYRQQRQLSLDALSELTSVSKPMLGQIERGTSNPTVAVLWKIAAGLQVPFASFFVKNPSIKLLRAEEQTTLQEQNGLFEAHNTFAMPGLPVEIYRIRLLPGCRHISEPAEIGAIKSLTVYSGCLTIGIGSETHTLQKGDATSFSTDVSQVYQNLTNETCEYSMTIFYSNPAIQGF